MAENIVARRNTWQCSWEVDLSAQAKVASIPFKDMQLFGEGVEWYLMEDKDKKKVLPSCMREIKQETVLFLSGFQVQAEL